MKKVYEDIFAKIEQMSDDEFLKKLESYKDDPLALAFDKLSEFGAFVYDSMEGSGFGLVESLKFSHRKDDDFLSVKDEDFELYSYDFVRASNDSSYALAA